MGLSVIPVAVMGDGLVNALGAVAAVETAVIGNGRPPTPGELRAHLADALTADLRQAPGERRLWPALDACLSVSREAGTADGAGPAEGGHGPTDDRRRTATIGITAPDGTDEAAGLMLAAAGVVLGLRITVVSPDGVPVEFGPSSGRRVVLVRLAAPGPYTGSWGATESVVDPGPASAQVPPQARTPDVRPASPRTQIPATRATAGRTEPSSVPHDGGSRAGDDGPPMANLGVDPFGAKSVQESPAGPSSGDEALPSRSESASEMTALYISPK